MSSGAGPGLSRYREEGEVVVSAPEVLMEGIVFGESPRWHDGRVWFSDWGANQVITLDADGSHEVVVTVRSFPMCIDFLPDGRLLVGDSAQRRLLRREPDGSLVQHADLSGISEKPWNDIVIDGRGDAYVNTIGFDFPGGEFAPGLVVLVTPEGNVGQVADDLAFPNGMAISPDGATLVVAESRSASRSLSRAAAAGPATTNPTQPSSRPACDQGERWQPSLSRPACHSPHGNAAAGGNRRTDSSCSARHHRTCRRPTLPPITAVRVCPGSRCVNGGCRSDRWRREPCLAAGAVRQSCSSRYPFTWQRPRRKPRRCMWRAGPGCRGPCHTSSWFSDRHERRLPARRAAAPRRPERR
jgi:hypothetical protein